MNFKDFWDKLQTELKQEKEFVTLKQKKKFKARFESDSHGEFSVIVIPEQGKQRGRISSNEFEGIWDNAKGLSHETRFVNKDGRLEPYPTKKAETGKSIQISYVIALINHVIQNQNME